MSGVHPFLQRSAAVLPWLGLVASMLMAFVATLFGVWAIPQFASVYDSFGVELPWITRVFSQAYLLVWLAPALVCAIWHFGPAISGRIAAGLLGLAAALLAVVSVLFAMYLPYFMMGSLV